MSQNQPTVFQAVVPGELSNKRLDQALAALFPDFSRAQLQQWIKQGKVLLDEAICDKPRQKVVAQQRICLTAKLTSKAIWVAQAIPLNIVLEDEAMIIINKPAGLIVHPGAGHPDGTLVNALLHHSPQLELVPRAGIIHRLDKDTTGLLLVAKTPSVHNTLTQAMKARQIKRSYVALVKGNLISGGSINQPIGRHPIQRTKMAVCPNGREAITHYRITERFPSHTLLDVELETGRTHQIRVHMTHIHYPLAGDATYGNHIALPTNLSNVAKNALIKFKRQALHARQLCFTHPESKESICVQATLPEDFSELLRALRLE